MTLRIRIDHGQDAGKTWRLSKAGTYLMGRPPDATLPVLDMKVSKEHAKIILTGDDDKAPVILKDLGSRHGTLVNGQPVTGKVRIKPGDEVRVGLSILRVLSDGEADVESEPLADAGMESTVDAANAAAGTQPKRKKVFAPDGLVGQEVGGYKVQEKVGQGGMGSVYVAEQLSLNREVAFKVLNEKLTKDRAFVDQFVNEARSAAALNHPNVVQVYDVGRENGRYYFSMEFVVGGSIEEKLAEEGAQSWRDGLNWLIDAANALIFAQKREILHRDVKPDNLMLAEDGSAKLCDLGLAKKSAHADMLAAGIIGTPAFISPEAIRRKKDIDVKSDLYSLGCTFYRILTGENPYPGKTVKEILLGHLNKPVPRVSAKVSDIPHELDDVIYTLMQKDPAERFESPGDLLQALDKIRVQHGLEKHGLRPGSRKPLLIALAVVVLLGAAAVIYAVTREPAVVVPPKTQEELEEERRQAALLAQQQFDIFKGDAELDFQKLDSKEKGGNLRFDDNAFESLWPDLIQDYRALATRLTTNEEYGTHEDIVRIADRARGSAVAIEDYVNLRKRLDKDIKDARKLAIGDLKQALAGVRKTYDDAIEAKAWIKAASAVLPDAIAKIVKPFLEKMVKDILPETVPAETRAKFGTDPLLDAEKHVQPLLKEYLPGDPPGKTLLDAVLVKAEQAHRQTMDRVEQHASASTHDGYRKAIEVLEAYLELLPEGLDPKAGPVQATLVRFRTEASEALEKAESADARLLVADIRHDQMAYWLLLKALRSPGGYFDKLALDDAVRFAESSAAKMRYRGYARLAAEVVEDAKAYRHLFQRLVETFPDGWVKDKIVVQDARGKDVSVKAKDVTTTGLKLGTEVKTFAELGPAWVLKHIFYAPTGEPRFAFEGDDYRGLAVLAEIGSAYDRVGQAYQKYLATLGGERTDSQNEIRERMGRLPRERAVAEAWRIATENAAWIDDRFNEHDPALLDDPEVFWEKDDHRKALLKIKKELHTRIQDAWEALAALQDPKYADTVWSAVLQTGLPRAIRWAKEPIVSAPPEVPDKPDAPDDQDDPEKPGEEKPPEAPADGDKDADAEGAPER